MVVIDKGIRPFNPVREEVVLHFTLNGLFFAGCKLFRVKFLFG